jgi:tryptophan 2,3-dioxygenase
MYERKEPILEAPGGSDYERYIRTDALLALQPEPETWAHRDELLFTVVHQASELWLKLAAEEISTAMAEVEQDRVYPALRLLRRSVICIQHTITALDMLEEMTPWEYQQVRTALGHGSGFDSPGFNRLRILMPKLVTQVQQRIEATGRSLAEIYINQRDHEQLIDLLEAVLTIDERLMDWRARHFRVVERTIGLDVEGTQGTPVTVLRDLRDTSFVPDIWSVRTQITEHATEILSD